jgi:hypothetical protein
MKEQSEDVQLTFGIIGVGAGRIKKKKSVITTILRNGFGPICGCVKSDTEQRASFARGRQNPMDMHLF